MHIVYSQESTNKKYVQDLISEQADFIANVLQNKGVLMICGAVAMQNEVLDILDTISRSKLNVPLSDFKNREQLKMDCY